MQSFRIQTHKRHTRGLTLVSFEPCTPSCNQKKKKTNSEEKEQAERREEGAPQGEGENGSACSFCFPLFHRGAPIDRSSAQIRQQMLELTVSFNRGKKAQKATSRAPLLHRLIPSSLCLLEAPCISPINRFNTPNMKNMH